jgi:hypothetical protein
MSKNKISQKQSYAKTVLFFLLGGFCVALICVFDIPTFCVWKKIFHIPCAGCGLTRAFKLAWTGDFWQATQMNILFVPLCLGTLTFLICFLVQIIFRKPVLFFVTRFVATKRVMASIIVLTILSFIYNSLTQR